MIALDPSAGFSWQGDVNSILLTLIAVAITYAARQIRMTRSTIARLEKQLVKLGVFLFGIEGEGGGLNDRVKRLEETFDGRARRPSARSL